MTSRYERDISTRESEDVDQSDADCTARGVVGVEAATKLSLSLMRLRAGERALDLGSGIGDDPVQLGRIVGKSGTVVGLEKSESVVVEARGRLPKNTANVVYEQGDMHELRFADDEFDASRAARVFLHLEDPDRALREMVRVTKPGGRLVAFDPDVESFAVDSDDPESSRKVGAVFPSLVRHSQMGRSLRRRFVEAGLRDVEVTVVPMVFRDYETASTQGAFDRLFDRMVESKIATQDRATAIRSEFLKADARGTFAMYGSLYVACGIA